MPSQVQYTKSTSRYTNAARIAVMGVVFYLCDVHASAKNFYFNANLSFIAINTN